MILRVGRRPQFRKSSHELVDELGEAGAVGLGEGADDEVHRGEDGEEMQADDLAEAALETVAVDGRRLVPRHDDADPRARARQRGSDGPDLEVPGPDALPLSPDLLEIGVPRQPPAARKAPRLRRRRRTCSGA